MPFTDGVQTTQRPRLLIHAAAHKWSDLLRTAESHWELVWVASDEQFAEQLAQQRYPVALCEQPAAGIESFDKPLPESRGSTKFLQLSDDFPEDRLDGERDYLARIHSRTTPSELSQWLQVAHEVHRIDEERTRLQRRLALRRSPIIGCSSAIERLRVQVASAALCDWPVLIQGEPGSGRDLVAQAIHEASERSHRPFIKINCRVHTAVSLERELFGQAALKTSETASAGRFDLADGGVILLDGIDEISLPLQNVLARVLESKSFQRLGEAHESPLTARVVAIATRNLAELANQGDFREELLRHFAGPVLTLPALREIRSDIAPLTEHLLQKVAQRLGEPPRRLMLETLQHLQAHNWPGNVRELELLIERACTTQQSARLTPEMVDAWINAPLPFEATNSGVTLAQMERQLIEATFSRCAGNRELTAQTLQIGLRTLSGKLRDYGYPPRGGPGSNQLSREREAA